MKSIGKRGHHEFGAVPYLVLIAFLGLWASRVKRKIIGYFTKR
ncbi:MAG: hypothetical protein ABIG28_02355 [archaeon]